MSTPEMRVCAVNGTTTVVLRIELRLREAEIALGERDDRAAFGRIVGKARGKRGGGEIFVRARR